MFFYQTGNGIFFEIAINAMKFATNALEAVLVHLGNYSKYDWSFWEFQVLVEIPYFIAMFFLFQDSDASNLKTSVQQFTRPVTLADIENIWDERLLRLLVRI